MLGLRRYFASTPAGLHVPFWRYFRYYPIRTLLSALFLALLSSSLVKGIASVISGERALSLPLCLLGIIATVYFMNFWYGVRSHFLVGDANPAVVVSVTPPLAAVYTDLGRRGPYPAFPVVKIVRVRLSGRDGEPAPRVGEKLVMVSVYLHDAKPGAAAWGDFRPLPAFVATGDSAQHRSLAEQLGDSEWAQLDFYLKQVRKPYRVGLFRMMPMT